MVTNGDNVARQAVSGPATGLLVTGILMVIATILSLILNLAGIGFGAAAVQQQPLPDPAAAQQFQMVQLVQGTTAIVVAILGFVFGAIVIFGALKMKKLESYGLAMTASILAMLPCSICCLLGLPIGIWSLVTLNKPEVKSGFR